MTRFLTVLGLALALCLPVVLSADEVLDSSHEGVDLLKVTHYDDDGASNKVEFFADNKNSYDIVVDLEIKDSSGLSATYEEDGTFVAAGEKRLIASFALEEVGGTGNYEFDWFVIPDHEVFDTLDK